MMYLRNRKIYREYSVLKEQNEAELELDRIGVCCGCVWVEVDVWEQSTVYCASVHSCARGERAWQGVRVLSPVHVAIVGVRCSHCRSSGLAQDVCTHASGGGSFLHFCFVLVWYHDGRRIFSG